ncbi:hypothetical protein V8C26DRAFT_413074 [Trichoderma gracile]
MSFVLESFPRVPASYGMFLFAFLLPSCLLLLTVLPSTGRISFVWNIYGKYTWVVLGPRAAFYTSYKVFRMYEGCVVGWLSSWLETLP